MLEYVSVVLGVIAGITTAVAYVYRRGRTDGIDNACELRIKEDVQSVKAEIKNMETKGDREHKEIYNKMAIIDSKIDRVVGSVDIIKELVTKKD